jgi:hypothetical protein
MAEAKILAPLTGIVDGEIDLFDFNENTDVLWKYWVKELSRAKNRRTYHESMSVLDEELKPRKGFGIRAINNYKKRRNTELDYWDQRVAYSENMLKEIKRTVLGEGKRNNV